MGISTHPLARDELKIIWIRSLGVLGAKIGYQRKILHKILMPVWTAMQKLLLGHAEYLFSPK